MRIFISVEIPEEIKEKIKEIQEQLPELEGKRTEAENLHLTLKFLGEVDEERIEEVKKRLEKVKLNSFEAKINSIGMFSDRIVWLGMKNCEGLQKEIDKALSGLFDKEERFMGHLTIARVRNFRDKGEFLEKIKIPEMKFIVKNFNLKKSTLSRSGSIYEDIEKYNLP